MEIDHGPTDSITFVEYQTRNKVRIMGKGNLFKFNSDDFRSLLEIINVFF